MSFDKFNKSEKNFTEEAKSVTTGITNISLEQPAAYSLSVEQTEKYFSTNIEKGLTNAEAKLLQHPHGLNSLGESAKISYLTIFAHQVFNAMILVLLISMIIALAIKDWISGGVIGAVLFINISIGFFQELKAEETMGSLKSLSSPTALVTRNNGDDITIAAVDVVPGDIVHIRVGDTVPADLRLVSSTNLETDEALLTGESLPIVKNYSKVFTHNTPVGDRLNMVYASSVVSKGRGTGIVVSTGLNTEIGQIAKSLNGDSSIFRKVKKEDDPTIKDYTRAFFGTIKDIIGNFLGISVGTPLQRKLSWLAIFLFWISVIFAIIVMATRKMKVDKEIAIYAICVALSMIPSALIVVLTITMSVGAQVMVEKNVIVRKLDSLEALGGVNDICSDKTGTLTQGKMITRKVWIPTIGTYSMENSNDPYNPLIGDLFLTNLSPVQEKKSEIKVQKYFVDKKESSKFPDLFKEWLLTASMANIATIQEVKNGETGDSEWKAHGDPTEVSIQVFVSRVNYGREMLLVENPEYRNIIELPFDSSIKIMSSIWKLNDSTTKIFTKGAAERILPICNHFIDSPMDHTTAKMIEENVHALSLQGLRVLAFASKDIDPQNVSLKERKEVENKLTFHGLVGIHDPPRVETAQSVKECHNAGINVHMLTGDHQSTANAIAQEVGILPRNLYHYSKDVIKAMSMRATEFDKLTDLEIDQLPVLPLVIARCAPQTKVRMIEALHRRKKFCVMTGDGVNDSPSLKIADVGIAMGLNGSDVAKEASDIVLKDDNFASILNAIEEGRRMADNIQKFILQLLAENVAQAIYLMAGLAFRDDTHTSVFPLSPVEVLWILVITSCFPAMGLGQEKASENILQKSPKSKIFTKELILDMFAYGIWMGACCMIAFVVVVYGVGDGNLGDICNSTSADLDICGLVFRGRSTSFATMTWCALILAWECIHSTNSLFYMRQDTDNSWIKQTWLDLWGNQFLFWSVVLGAVTVFPVVYIPVINTKVFLHAPIGYEWGVAVAFSILYLAGSEFWKWMKRIYNRKTAKKTPELALQKKDPFQRFASFSMTNTVDPVLL